MSIRYILFDLDGTLLPMDQDVFVQAYLEELSRKMAPHGYDPKQLVKAIWEGTGAMVRNDGSQSNERVFWRTFESQFGSRVQGDLPLFDEFYRTEFQRVAKVCGCNPAAADCVSWLWKQGYTVALATNPVFPAYATESRIRWAGLSPGQFALYTTYENSSYCKPNPRYYLEIVQRLGCSPRECLMVGNDVDEDMVAETVGMQVFLLTDCLLNRHNVDLSAYRSGGFAELMDFLKEENHVSSDV